jgi:hypothetical protein
VQNCLGMNMQGQIVPYMCNIAKRMICETLAD